MGENRQNVAELTDVQREQALKRFEQIRPYFEEGVSQAELARVHQVPLKTLQRWVHRYRVGGLSGLARPRRADAGKVRHLPEELVRLIEGLYLCTPRPMIMSVYRNVCRVAQEHHWHEPSYDQVYRVVQRLSPALVTFAHEGATAYREQFDLLCRFEATRANELWQADHCRLHLWLLTDRGTAVKPFLTIVLDDYSRCIAGYRLSWNAPSAAQTSLALRGAIWRKEEKCWMIRGVPEVFYSDHGSDFTSKHLQAVAADLKMQVIFSRKGRPRGRGKIERFFRTVEQELLSDLPGYAPKVDWRQQAESETQTRPAAALTLPEFDALFRTWLLERYHEEIQEGIGEPPRRRWEAAGSVPVLPPSLEQLDLLLLTFSTRRRVQQDGIAFQGQCYFDLTLAEYIGEDVVVRYDPADLREIAIYVSDGGSAKESEYLRERFVCRATCREVTKARITVQEVVATRSERRKALSRELRGRKQTVERYSSHEMESQRWKEAAQQAVRTRSDLAAKDVVEEPRRELAEPEEEESWLKRYAHE